MRGTPPGACTSPPPGFDFFSLQDQRAGKPGFLYPQEGVSLTGGDAARPQGEGISFYRCFVAALIYDLDYIFLWFLAFFHFGNKRRLKLIVKGPQNGPVGLIKALVILC